MKAAFTTLCRGLAGGALCVLAVGPASADETDAKALLRAMSDYMVALDGFSFDYDATHEVVTTAGEKLGLASSGAVAIDRPDRMHATSRSGFADLEMAFDGKILGLRETENALFAAMELPGSIDGLVDTLRDTYGRPLPAADLIGSDPYRFLMGEVTEVKDLGSGVIGGTECDHLAFRNAEVDWQIWIAQGEAPHPCRLVITSRDVAQAPQYSITLRNWQAGTVTGPFTISAQAGETQVEIGAFAAAQSFPDHFLLEGRQ